MQRGSDPRSDLQALAAVDPTRRTRLANERTYLAWWRSALGAIGASLVVGKLIPELTAGPRWPYVVLGAALGAAGIVLGLTDCGGTWPWSGQCKRARSHHSTRASPWA